MEYVLQTDELCKYYRNFKALDGLSIKVPKGSVYGLVGRNGAGKTTLIRLISGLQPITAGEYTLYGKKNTDADLYKARKRMGAVVETPSIYLSMTAEDNLRQQYRILGLPSCEDIQELLDLVGLSNTGGKKAGKFSLGMRQRLGIAIALAGNPDFLVLDEPINGLDPQGIIEIRELILKLNRERRITVLISSHILDELSKLATHYGFVNRGKMVKEISAEALEGACRTCIKVTVSDVGAFARMLDSMGLVYSVLDDRKVDIYSKVNVTELVMAYAQEDGEIFSMHEQDESLESYFLNLVGGERDV